MKNRLVARGVATAMATATLALGLAAAPAQAATCYASSCQGKDPQDAGCAADAATIASIYGPYGEYQLRYSPKCQATWTRLTSTGTPQLGAWLMVSTFSTSSSLSTWKGVSYQWPVPSAGKTAWTDMVNYQGQYSRACYNNTSDPRPASGQCSAAR